MEDLPEALPPEAPPPANRVNSRGRLIRAIGVVAGGAAALTGLLFAKYNMNQSEAENIPAVARSLAENRTVCTIAEGDTVITDQLELQVTATLAPGEKPEAHNDTYDRLGMDVNFQDLEGNMVNGLTIINETDPRRRPYVYTGSEAGAEAKTATTAMPLKYLSFGKGKYAVYWRTAVQARVEGWLVDSRYPVEVVNIPCGDPVEVEIRIQPIPGGPDVLPPPGPDPDILSFLGPR